MVEAQLRGCAALTPKLVWTAGHQEVLAEDSGPPVQHQGALVECCSRVGVVTAGLVLASDGGGGPGSLSPAGEQGSAVALRGPRFAVQRKPGWAGCLQNAARSSAPTVISPSACGPCAHGCAPVGHAGGRLRVQACEAGAPARVHCRPSSRP